MRHRRRLLCILAAAVGACAPAAWAAPPQQSGHVDLATQSADITFTGGTNREGHSVARAGDVNGDGIDDMLIGAPDNSPTTYVVYGSASPTDLAFPAFAPARGIRLTGAANGSVVAGVGDVNDDGIDDIATASPGGGPAYVVYGSKNPVDVNLAALTAAQGFRIIPSSTWDKLGDGTSVAGAGDVNDDGIADIVVGTPGAGVMGGTDEGGAYVIYGSAAPADVTLATLTPAAGFPIKGVGSAALTGLSVAAAGDVNDDGVDDVVIGARFASPGTTDQAGAAYVVYGAKGTRAGVDLAALGTQGFAADGPEDYAEAGYAVAGAGDVNGDGIDDVVVGARRASPGGISSAGTTYVVYGATNPANVNLASIGTRGFFIDGVEEDQESGTAVAGIGDLDGDGFDDVALGSPGGEFGPAYVVFGAASTAPTGIDLATLGARGVRVDGTTSYGAMGSSVAGLDANGDGHADVMMSQPAGAKRAVVLYGWGASTITYSGAISATAGTAITPVTPVIARTGAATVTVSPALPAGLSLDAATGRITGTPTAAGVTTHTVTLADANGTVQTTLSITVATGTPAPGGGSPGPGPGPGPGPAPGAAPEQEPSLVTTPPPARSSERRAGPRAVKGIVAVRVRPRVGASHRRGVVIVTRLSALRPGRLTLIVERRNGSRQHLQAGSRIRTRITPVRTFAPVLRVERGTMMRLVLRIRRPLPTGTRLRVVRRAPDGTLTQQFVPLVRPVTPPRRAPAPTARAR